MELRKVKKSETTIDKLSEVSERLYNKRTFVYNVLNNDFKNAQNPLKANTHQKATTAKNQETMLKDILRNQKRTSETFSMNQL